MSQEVGDFLAELAATEARLSVAVNDVKKLKEQAEKILDGRSFNHSDERELLALQLPMNDPMYGWLPGKLYAKLTGYTEDAMRKKARRDDFVEGVHYIKAEFDGKLWYNYPAIARLAVHGA